MTEQEIWLRAWCAVANTYNGSEAACTRFADSCLRDFRARFPRVNEDLLDVIEQEISDSMDIDWTARDGAKAVIELLRGKIDG